MTDVQIKHMVDRFLRWEIPSSFHPDGGISYEPIGNKGTKFEFERNPHGTNLFDYQQATAMVRNMLEGLPSA